MRLYIIIGLVACLLGPAWALPEKAYISVPFLCQAPRADWSQPWQDACEEAAVIMAMDYMMRNRVQGSGSWVLGKEKEILELVEFQIKKYGGHFDLTAEQAARLIRDFYKYNDISVRYDIVVNDIKSELAAGHLVLAPMAGRLLGNPYYTPPGPAYHYMLFKGYDDRTGEFITNDMGTRRGRNYRYKYQVAYNAIHDWTGSKQTIASGRKAVIVIKSK
ncbi:MAG: C39 family peptidase [Candidatus Saganbacteria bacterium]|nr:C39 family peptidase [Candidatus Saganbacteria bacterium]